MQNEEKEITINTIEELFSQGNYEKAFEACEQKIKSHPTESIFYFLRGRARVKFGQYHEAIEDASIGIAAYPRMAAPYVLRAVAKKYLLDFPGAVADATSAIDVDPFFADAYVTRAHANLLMGGYHEALADTKNDKRLHNKMTHALQAESNFYLLQHHKTIQHANEASLPAIHALSNLQHGNLQTALDTIPYISFFPRHYAVSDIVNVPKLPPISLIKERPDTFYDQILFYLMTALKDIATWSFNQAYYLDALENINRVIAVSPSDIDAYILRAHVYFSTKHYEKSAEDAQHVLALSSEDVRANSLLLASLSEIAKKSSNANAVENALFSTPVQAPAQAQTQAPLHPYTPIRKAGPGQLR